MKKRKNKAYFLDIEAWNDKLSVYFSDLNYILRDLKKVVTDEEYQHQKEFLEKEKLGGFSNIELKKGGHALVIWIPNWDTTIDVRGTLVHECLHAAACLLEKKGVPLRIENDEVLAYLTEYLFKKCLSFAVKNKLWDQDKKYNSDERKELSSLSTGVPLETLAGTWISSRVTDSPLVGLIFRREK